ncbi:TIGR01777 family oxidoreductase [Pseudolysinimonas sp.]|uniref:TIGR01777 family oxidoreductase n=1 Tax=Pseudolysinimonas sp. TaxID=2680009 RepID=UPI003F7EFEBB
MRVLVAGASGLIGTELVRTLRADGHEVRRLVRRRPSGDHEVNWAPSARTIDVRAVADVDAVVNLSGASIARLPWTRGYRRELVESRVAATRTLADAMNQVRTPPRVFVSGSAVGFYGDRPGERLTEGSSRGEGFFPDLVEEWEATARLAPAATRVVQVRTGVVIARGGGMAPVRTLTGLGLGTRFGTGGQHWPWISLHDEVAAMVHLLTRSELAGPVNLVGPTFATSDRITHGFARRMHRPYLLRAPEGAIRALLGEAGQSILLDSMKVVPERLAADGFAWRHERVEDAIDAVVAPERAE